MKTGPSIGPVLVMWVRRSACDLLRQFAPGLADAFLRDTHVLADHVPVHHRTMLHDGGAGAGGGHRAGCPGVRDEGNADRQRHTENNSEKYAHDGLPKILTSTSHAENASDRNW